MTGTSGSATDHASAEPLRLEAPPSFADVFRSSLLLTAACVGCFALLAATSTRPFPFWCKLAVYVVGFTHFAVGYAFMAQGTSRVTLGWRDTAVFSACVALGLAYYFVPGAWLGAATTLLYTTVFCHLAENAVYHAHRRPAPGQAISLGAVFPFVAGLVSFRAVSIWRAGEDPWLNGAFIVAFLWIVRARLPGTDWAAGWRALGSHLPLVALFGGVGVLLHESMFLWDVFIVWHYLTWIVYQWGGAPALRPRLVWTHAAFGSIYAVLAGAVMWSVLSIPSQIRPAVVVVAGPLAFYAQTMAHNLITLMFRQYAPRF